MDLRVIGVLLLVPLLDVMVLVILATRFDPVAIVALVVLTALVGMLLVRAEGRRTIRKLQRKLARGEVPADELLDGGLLLVSGALLLTPGLVTDFLGFLLVVPVTRYPIRMAVRRYVVDPYADAKARGFVSGDVYIDGFPDGGEGEEPYDLDDDAYDVDVGGSGGDDRPE